MFIVTVKSIDADSFALPTLYGKTMLQKYDFSTNPQGVGCDFCFRQGLAPPALRWLSSLRDLGCAGRRGLKSPVEILSPLQGLDG